MHDPNSVASFIGWMAGGETTKEVSLDEHTSHVREAVYQKFAPKSDLPGGFSATCAAANPSIWVVDVYPDSVIVCKGVDHFRIPYAMQDGQVVLADQMIPVEKVWRDKV